MSDRHISLPRTFSSGNASEWFQRFEICCKANAWNDATKALKLPTLLEGEALATWLELGDEKQATYTEAKKGMLEKMTPAEFVSISEFHNRRLRPGEALSVFVHELKQLLTRAMPKVEGEARDQLLLHQFLSGLPEAVSKQLRASGQVKDLQAATEHAKLLMTVDEQYSVAAVVRKSTEVDELQDQMALLQEQVAALTTSTKSTGATARETSIRCYQCHKRGHMKRDCPSRQIKCWKCGRFGHIERYCHQPLNDNGASGWGSGRPSQ